MVAMFRSRWSCLHSTMLVMGRLFPVESRSFPFWFDLQTPTTHELGGFWVEKNKPIGEYSNLDGRTFRTSIISLPKNRKKKKQYRDFNLHQLLEMDVPEDELTVTGIVTDIKIDSPIEQLSIQSFEQAIRSDPDQIRAYHSLGNAYVRSGNVEKGIEQIKKYQALKPYLNVVSQLDIATRRTPESSERWYQLGFVHTQHGT